MLTPTSPGVPLPYPLATYRRAVLAAFAINGFLYASWAARVPAIQEQYGVNDANFGLVLITASGGAFLSMPFAAYLNARFGVVTVATATALLYACAVMLMPQLTSRLAVFPLFFVMGIGFGLLDVAMNAQAVEVEKLYGKPIMSSFHAGFSAAMIAGALVGSAVIFLKVGFAWHLAGAGLAALLALAWAAPRFYPHVSEDDAAAEADGAAFRLPVRATWLLGFVGLCSMMSEASIADWTSKFMLEVAGARAYIAPLSLAAFSITMTVGRVFGDGLRERHGDARLLRGGATLAFVGMAITLAYPTAATTILGAALIGSGLSIAVPVVFSLSGGIPGLTASAALAMVTTVSYLGLFVGPAIIGFLSEAFGLRVGYSFILVILGILVAATFRIAPRAPRGAVA